MTGERHRPISRYTLVVALGALAFGGVMMDIIAPGPRTWLYHHSFTNAVLVGTLLITATYLVVERALAEREQRRWSEAARPLLRALATAAATTDRDLRAAAASGTPVSGNQYEWLSQLLERYHAVLTGTPELIDRWHAALSLAQHARSCGARSPLRLDAGYESAWARFRATFAGEYDFAETAASAGATWRLPVVPAPEQPAQREHAHDP